MFGRGWELGLEVLNAFRHQRSFHRQEPFMLVRQGCVLNAFRHQRSFHYQNSSCPLVGFKCSTPFGIKGVSTARKRRREAAVQGAQRLSASKEFPLEKAGLLRP